MNGVRRFLGGGLANGAPSQSPPQQTPIPPPIQPTAPLSISKPSWPPSPTGTQPDSPLGSPKTTTVSLFLRKDKQRPVAQPGEEGSEGSPGGQSTRPTSNSSSILSPSRSRGSMPASSPATTPGGPSQSLPSSPGAGPSSSPVRPGMSNRKSVMSRKSIHHVDQNFRPGSGMFNTKDELLMDLLASEAVVDSRNYLILSAEEVEELKKEQQVLTSRLVALDKKLTLETKIRDAAVSLSKVNAANKKMSKQTQEQLDAANNKVDVAQKELWRVSERANDISRKLLEHRAGVLGFSVRSLEKKNAPNNDAMDFDGSGYDTPNRSSAMSPTSSAQTSVSSKARFEGPHYFAGHVDAIVPQVPRPPPTIADIITLEEKLKVVSDNLSAANRKQVEMRQELSLLQLEKEQLETSAQLEIQDAEASVAAIQQELLEEKETWERDRAALEERDRQIETLESRLEVLEEQSGEVSELQDSLVRARQESQRKDLEIEDLRSRLDIGTQSGEAKGALLDLQDELDRYRQALHQLTNAHGITVASADPSFSPSIEMYIEAIAGDLEERRFAQLEWVTAQRKLEETVQEANSKASNLAQELDRVKREREEIRSQLSAVRSSPQERSTTPSAVEYTGDAAKVMAVLQPLWSILPSPEARASKLGPRAPFRTGLASPTSSPGSPKIGATSLSDLDVRTLKTLYDNRVSNPASPNFGSFTVEALAARVQALVQDDRALIERLIRFAQAHDLLKKNAERAQKLAQESNQALETYQKQVKTLEERHTTMAARQTALQQEVDRLQETIERITAEKHEVEMHAAEQAETCRQLTQANNALSAQTLTLAEEAASASEGVRRQTEAQLVELKTSLQKAEDELEAFRISEQSQRAALLDELNSMQTENGNLRAQLRAVAAKK
ncbi:hypothetical protein NEOLEDRAFT_1134960 [Neolentinus lepideus HHB14362 ss-1]|uniref:Up-regulated during septation protein 1 domain-containing protein n=1 Tax=Neolentinus lepideus HHB14362 ss-1 TaxID=1314782 RepID=A0A165S1S5_9AGAM|nr:hypothetical protein NEOLEDRAFT_1134960 [Neolentinus lepideus HHB14362 ss-1]